MTELPPPRAPGDVDEWYRRIASSDQSRPSETVRQAVLDHAAKLAATHAAKLAATRAGVVAPISASGRRRGSWAWRGPAVAGTLAAALAAVMLLPRFLPPPAGDAVVPVPAPPASAVPRAPLPNGLASTSAAAPVTPAPAAPAPAFPAPPAPAPTAQVGPRPEDFSRYSEDVGHVQSNARPSRNAAPPVVARESSFAKQSIAEAPQTQAMSQSHGMTQLQANSPTRTAITTNRQGSQETAAALRHAAEVGDLSALGALLQKPVDIDSRDSLGRTALMLATLHGQISTAAALLDHGADPNAADARGTTPLEAAQAGKYPDIVSALERYGAR